jgi:hypothetical protein
MAVSKEPSRYVSCSGNTGTEPVGKYTFFYGKEYIWSQR